MVKETFVQKLRIPVIGAPMFLISQPDLVVAQCCAGIAAAFPSLNARPQALLKNWIVDIKARRATFKRSNPQSPVGPFGVNLVALDSNKRLQQDLEVCIDHKVPFIITSMKPPTDVNKAIHDYGGLHFHDVVNRRHALKAIEAGVDGLILVCAGAGGHAGMLNPFAFLAEIRPMFDGLIILAGCINAGHEIAAAKLLGADLVYMGTRFIATTEAHAQIAYKQLLVDAKMDDILYTSEFTGVNANFIKQSIANAGINLNRVAGPRLTKPSKWYLAWKHWRMKHKKQWKDIWSAGQGVAGIHNIMTVEDLVHDLEEAYKIAAIE